MLYFVFVFVDKCKIQYTKIQIQTYEYKYKIQIENHPGLNLAIYSNLYTVFCIGLCSLTNTKQHIYTIQNCICQIQKVEYKHNTNKKHTRPRLGNLRYFVCCILYVSNCSLCVNTTTKTYTRPRLRHILLNHSNSG